MDIGPVRRRLTAEPVSSPVPGEESWLVEPAMLETEHPAPADATVATRPEPAR
ncbi:hypothetical protein PHK61_29805 [Actinomycetospora lutea]|uniref:hypothetical protein n=1 Tax=Actinomycetospora lutea TaxID=663604 RepID=UPI002365D37A|nr:hypothetical protein [Actinomycetospora lutea]MDD7942615.1 hypothetical protein [Actinomycetospora lutea]